MNKSALSVKGIAHLISDTLASLDPFSFEPRGPLGSWHKFARAQQFHFGLLKDGVKKYFDQHWDEMVEDWGPVHQYFRSLFKRSPQYRSWNGEELNPDKWQDLREIGGLGPQLPEREKLNPGDETVKSMRWIAKNPEGPGKHDREMIEHFVVDFIHRVTLWHSWIHRTQYASSKDFPAVSDPNFAPVVLHSFGDAPFGGITEQEAIEQLSIGATFGGFKVENYTLLKDGNGVVEEIASRVAQASGKYLKLGIDAKKEIMFGTVI